MSDLPPFLYGTFDWLINGVFIDGEGEPSLDLKSDEALAHANPWIVIAAVLECAKAGDHTQAHRLQRYFELDEPFALNRVALVITGMTAASSDLELLIGALGSASPWTRAFAAQGAREAGALALVRPMVKAWSGAETANQRRMIAEAICDLLEAEGGELRQESAYYNAPPVDPATLGNPATRALAEERAARPPIEERFPDLVDAACGALEEEHGTADITLWAGEPRHPRKLAEEALAALPASTTSGHLVHYRRMFEASTGTRCSGFFRWTELRRLEIQATLEDFLHLDKTAYVAGRRYFFGHPVP